MVDQDTVRENIEAFSANHMNRLVATLADDAVYYEAATQRRVQGKDEVVRVVQEWKQVFPDAKGTITNIFASGNQVVAEITWEGTHRGDLAGPRSTIPASGKYVRNEAAQVFAMEGGKPKEVRHYFDLMTILQQIGAAPQG